MNNFAFFVPRLVLVSFLQLIFCSLSHSYIYEITVLKRADETVILFADGHNLGGLEQVKLQGKWFAGFLAKIDKKIGKKATFLFEHSIAHSFLPNNFSYGNLNFDANGDHVYDFQGEFHWSSYLEGKLIPQSGRMNLRIKTSSKEFTTIHALIPYLGQINNIQKRSFDPRFPFQANAISLLKKKDIWKGVLLNTDYLFSLRKQQISKEDLIKIEAIRLGFWHNNHLGDWIGQIDHFSELDLENGPKLSHAILENGLVHYIDLSVLIDLLSSPTQRLKTVFAGGTHIEYIKGALIDQFGFHLVEKKGPSLRELNEGASSKGGGLFQMNQNQRVDIREKGGALLAPVNNFLKFRSI